MGTKVKCPLCDSERIIYIANQKFFDCCHTRHSIIENKVVEKKSQALLQNQEVINPKPASSPIEAGEETPKEAPQEVEDFEVEEEPEEVKKVEEEAPKSDFKCPQCNSPVEPYKDCMNPECKAEIIWGDK